MSLQNIFESCGDQLAWRTGKDLGEFICITFKKYVRLVAFQTYGSLIAVRSCVEATLALILLKGCQ